MLDAPQMDFPQMGELIRQYFYDYDHDSDDISQEELESCLLGRAKGLSEKDPASSSHEVNIAVGKIKRLLKSMSLAGASPETLRTEAERQLKMLEKSSNGLFKNREVFQDSSKELERFLKSFEVKLNRPSPDFSPLALFPEQPMTARQLLSQDPLWGNSRGNAVENMAGTIRVGRKIAGLVDKVDIKTGNPLPLSSAPIPKISPNEAKARRYRKFTRDKINGSTVVHAEVPKYKDVWYHATSLENAEGILQSGAVLRKDQGVFRGAFVASMPAIIHGGVVFVFNRNIECNNRVLNADYSPARGSHYVGFEEAIPVNRNTLEYVAVKTEYAAKFPLEKIAEMFSKIAGREIAVVPLEPVKKKAMERAERDGIFVPEEWPVEMHELSVDLQF